MSKRPAGKTDKAGIYTAASGAHFHSEVRAAQKVDRTGNSVEGKGPKFLRVSGRTLKQEKKKKTIFFLSVGK